MIDHSLHLLCCVGHLLGCHDGWIALLEHHHLWLSLPRVDKVSHQHLALLPVGSEWCVCVCVYVIT